LSERIGTGFRLASASRSCTRCAEACGCFWCCGVVVIPWDEVYFCGPATLIVRIASDACVREWITHSHSWHSHTGACTVTHAHHVSACIAVEFEVASTGRKDWVT